MAVYAIKIKKGSRRVLVWANKSQGQLQAYQTRAAANADVKRYLKGRGARVVKIG